MKKFVIRTLAIGLTATAVTVGFFGLKHEKKCERGCGCESVIHASVADKLIARASLEASGDIEVTECGQSTGKGYTAEFFKGSFAGFGLESVAAGEAMVFRSKDEFRGYVKQRLKENKSNKSAENKIKLLSSESRSNYKNHYAKYNDKFFAKHDLVVGLVDKSCSNNYELTSLTQSGKVLTANVRKTTAAGENAKCIMSMAIEKGVFDYDTVKIKIS